MARLVDEGIYAQGAQLYFEVDDNVVVDDAWGACSASPVVRTSVHPVYCASKPLLPLLVAHLAEQGLLGFDDPVAHLCPELSQLVPSATVADVLCHRAGLARPDAATWRMTPPARRGDLLQCESPAEGGGVGYSEVAGWFVLARVCEKLVGGPASVAAKNMILDPLGITGICVDSDAALRAKASGDLRLPVFGLPGPNPTPMLSEQLDSQLEEASLEFGGLASMSALGQLMSAVKRSLDGLPVEGMPPQQTLRDLLERRRAPTWDPVLGRRCEFAGGFMVGMTSHRIASMLSAQAIGHVAGVANCAVVTDPEQRLTIAIYLNGVSSEPVDVEFCRSALIDRLVRFAVAP